MSDCAIVTGAGGFIGSRLVARLIAEGIPVVAFTRRPPFSWRVPLTSPRLRWAVIDITDCTAVREAVAAIGPSLVFHLAAFRASPSEAGQWERMLSANVSGTLNMLSAVRDVCPDIRMFVNTGSSDEYGGATTPLNETCVQRPRSPYAWSKTAAVSAGLVMANTHGLPVVTLRPFLTYGPGQSLDMFVPSLIAACLRGHDFSMTSGHQRRDFNYVEDVVDAYILACERRVPPGEVINIGSGQGHCVSDMADMIVAKSGASIKLAKGRIPLRPGEADLVCDNTKARRLLGWKPNFDLDGGLAKTIDWYRANLVKFEGINA